MKSYLSLVSEYAKVHKKKNRLTIICIAISVMLVTAIFGLADMSVKAQINQRIRAGGNWHLNLNGISDEAAGEIASRNDVAVSSWVGIVDDINYEGKKLDIITYQGKEVYVQGSNEALAGAMNLVVEEGRFPVGEQEALFDRQGMEQFGLSIGDTVSLGFPDGVTRGYVITGVYGEFSSLQSSDSHGLFLSAEGVRALPGVIRSEYFYIQFRGGLDIRGAVADIQEKYGLSGGQVSPNNILLGLMGQSDDDSMWHLYITAVVLFVLVTAAGVFMIAGSFNMSVLERTQFFGLLRCLGASKKQIKRYIRLEGLLYSLKGIPAGLLAGCAFMWVAALILNMVDIGSALPEMELFQISAPGISAGCVMGFLVVMIASGAPARKAAEVSPQAAVAGNLAWGGNRPAGSGVNSNLRIDTAIGINHAFTSKKNMILAAGSVALSVILFLSFTVLIDFVRYAAKPLKPYAPDIAVMGTDKFSTVDASVVDRLKALPHIKQFYGRMYCYDVKAKSNGQDGAAVLVSFDEPQFNWAEEMLLEGGVDNVRNGNGLLAGYELAKENQWNTGDIVTLEYGGKVLELPVSGILSDTPFQAEGGEWVVICSEPIFVGLTGEKDYTVIEMQVHEDISSQIRSVIPTELRLLDRQKGNGEVQAAYYTMSVFVYGFMFVIGLVSFINILNMVNAGVSNRMGNYGVMRAVGASCWQLKKVIAAEAATYVVTGCTAGSIIGLFLHNIFYTMLITENWGETWHPPLMVLLVTLLAAALATLMAVVAPAKKIEGMSIVSVVNAD